MSLVLMESCDLPNLIGFAGTKWSVTSGGSFGDNFTVDGLKAWGSRFAEGNFYHDFPDDESTEVVVGVRINGPNDGYSSASTWISLLSDGGSTTQLTLFPSGGDGSLEVRRGDGTQLAVSAAGAYTANNWSYIEFRAVIDDSAGEIQVWVDNVQVINETGIDTRNGGTDAMIDRVLFRSANDVGYTYFRDIYILNDAGSDFNSRLGPVDIEAVLPDEAGDNSDWTPNGAASNYQCVDESDPDSDTTYVEATAAADRDDYGFAAPTRITADPLAVQAYALARFDGAPLDIASYVRRSSTNDDGTAETPTGSYGSRAITIWEEDPIAAAAWTLANLNASTFGLVTS